MTCLRRLATLSGCFLSILLCAGWVASAQQPLTPKAPGRAPGSGGDFEGCRAIKDDAARLRCFEGSGPAEGQKPDPNGPGNWRLVRTPKPGGGQDAVSITRTADITRSDLDFAGLMLRCGNGNPDVLIVLVRPVPPRARPRITVSAGGKSMEFFGTVVPPGAAVLLSNEASAMLAETWRAAPELAVEVDDQEGPIHGVVSLSGLGVAIRTLLANCPSS